MLTRRTLLAAPLIAGVAQVACVTGSRGAAEQTMQLAMHQNTSRAAGFRRSLEGWSRAGIQFVEIADVALDEFLAGDTLTGARHLMADLGLVPVSAAAVMPDVWIPGPERVNSLEVWRKRCEQYASLGVGRLYCPSITTRRVTPEDFAATPTCIREAGDIATSFGLIAMIEFARTSTHLATLASTLHVIRAAGHPGVRPMLDFFHFCSGPSKLEELDLLERGELAHVHFQDLKAGPRELVDNDWRLIPGDGIAPIGMMLRKLASKGYAGPLSVELFRREFVEGDPAVVAATIRTKCSVVMRDAGVA